MASQQDIDKRVLEVLVQCNRHRGMTDAEVAEQLESKPKPVAQSLLRLVARERAEFRLEGRGWSGNDAPIEELPPAGKPRRVFYRPTNNNGEPESFRKRRPGRRNWRQLVPDLDGLAPQPA